MPTTELGSMLRDFPRAHDFFVGVDSDGCVFDTMEVKHKDCFIPKIVEHYRLAALSRHVREVAEFLNLYSKWRGTNRFPGLVLTLDLLAEHPSVIRRGMTLPKVQGLRDWLARETRLGNPALIAEVNRTGDADLIQALAWSEDVNRSIEAVVRDVPPFPLVRESLAFLASRADLMVVSATPTEALDREWREHGLGGYVGLIAGQEFGSKKDVLESATIGRYQPEHVLMIGDAPGDLAAARANGVLFAPIDPGDEDESWRRLLEEGLPRFFQGSYAGTYMEDRIERFLSRLPETPPWTRS